MRPEITGTGNGDLVGKEAQEHRQKAILDIGTISGTEGKILKATTGVDTATARQIGEVSPHSGKDPLLQEETLTTKKTKEGGRFRK